ncbi:dihydrolipoamide acetyltransferase family protein [Staphylococcus lutrae]|uniref:Dihydrolipoamide acetyltransferase component of pyruvate dehydrogenase complex n=1 Tax=Staphylococcus lutrae TaxID=155085 RepID=A0AAC9RSH6_9STAP|nr:dihydrolipoamide acetyltransferase family protein [Staphylococcus lutrae]ARJ50839.1 dihydrolipoyllysine acetyltransferase [Staphylococcus lutrae]PNZ36805.1 2-oxo acid dehydrogenase subunit E2 [Staphylococcus lutrae]
MYTYIMPDAGEGTHESEILKWFVAEGDSVTEDQPLLEIQSDKAVVELPSPVSGTIKKLYVPEGEMAIVGNPIADIDTGDGESSSQAEAPAAEATEATETADEKVAQETTEAAAVSVASDADDVRHLAIPRVRIYARKHQVDLRQVKGTGNHGKITIEDIDAYINGGGQSNESQPTAAQEQSAASEKVEAPKAAQPVISSEGDRVEKMTPLRKIIAKAMVDSKHTSPHVTVFDQVEVSALVDHRNRMKGIAKDKNIKLTYTAYFVKAIVATLKRFPELNASINMDKGEVLYHNYFNVGVATNTDNGLFVPVVTDADRLSLFEIAEKVTVLSEKAQSGQLSGADMGSGSMTLTNVGGAATGGVWSTPIINQPEIAILGVGRIEEMFVPDENRQPVLKPILKLSFAFDHRAIDGVLAQQAINTLKMYLNNPDLLLAEG